MDDVYWNHDLIERWTQDVGGGTWRDDSIDSVLMAGAFMLGQEMGLAEDAVERWDSHWCDTGGDK